MKLWIHGSTHSNEEGPRVDVEMLRQANIELVGDPQLADHGIIFHIFDHDQNKPHHPLPKSRMIAIYDEPPTQAQVRNYKTRGEYHTFFSLVPCSGDNILRLTDDPIAFPYYPYTQYDIVRDDTRLRTRGVFFRASRRDDKGPKLNEFGARSLLGVRNRLVDDLLGSGMYCDLAGRGQGRYHKTHQTGVWPHIKRFEMRRTTADFALCIENSILDDYITEKIHHGFQSDLVVLYLGSPRIAEYVPPGAFVDLGRFLRLDEGRVDVHALRELLEGMTQDEYNQILHTARRWRRTDMLDERAVDACRRLTRMVIARLTGDSVGAPTFSAIPPG